MRSIWTVLLLAFLQTLSPSGCGGGGSGGEGGDASSGEADSDTDGDGDTDSDSDTGLAPLVLERVPVSWNTNSYVLGDEASAAVFDPGSPVDPILEAVGDRVVERVVLTHGHFDHITALDDLLAVFPDAIVSIHPDDEAYLFDVSLNLSTHFTGTDYVFAGEVDEYLNHGDTIEIAGRPVEIIHTPGHSPGSICLHTGDLLLSGDTLMKEQIGIVDGIPGLDEDLLVQSIRERLFVLDDDLPVHPGHGEPTTIGHEKEHGPAAETS